jgi:hypothetical protein
LSIAAEALPLPAAELFRAVLGRQKVADHPQNRCEKREQKGEVADVAGTEVFVDVLNIHC